MKRVFYGAKGLQRANRMNWTDGLSYKYLVLTLRLKKTWENSNFSSSNKSWTWRNRPARTRTSRTGSRTRRNWSGRDCVSARSEGWPTARSGWSAPSPIAGPSWGWSWRRMKRFVEKNSLKIQTNDPRSDRRGASCFNRLTNKRMDLVIYSILIKYFLSIH